MILKDVAITGIACRFPNAETTHSFWNNIINEIDCVEIIPKNRWNWQHYDGDPNTEVNKTFSRWMSVINNIDRFDATFFGISPREAEDMDPQQRIMLELAWSCIEDSGVNPTTLSGEKIGVFLGASNFDYKELQDKFSEHVGGHRATGTVNTILPNRISHFLNLHGPSHLIDTACSSSLVAIHQAITSISLGECDGALAGAINLLLSPTRFLSFGKTGMLSPNGRCKTFDESADGYVRGEGAGIIYLKPLDYALTDKDPIYGVIRGSAVNHGGRARTLTSPNAPSQSKVITTAIKHSGVDAADISYIETHGTGTPLGDPIEIIGLTRAFKKTASIGEAIHQQKSCALGSVKTNIGHLESSAGMAGLIKVLMGMQQQCIPSMLHFNQLNPRVKLKDSCFFIPNKPIPWHPTKNGKPIPRIAGISSFGFGGVNAHLVVEEFTSLNTESNTKNSSPEALTNKNYPIILSAKTQQSLQMSFTRYRDHLQKKPQLSIADISLTTTSGRQKFEYSSVFFASSTTDLVDQLDDSLEHRRPLNHHRQHQNNPKVAFLLTGQGSQYAGMGQSLYECNEIFRAAIDRCAQALSNLIDVPLTALLWGDNTDLLSNTQYTQPALFALEYSLAQLWVSLGVTPHYMIGHSVGEYVAACLSGVFSLNDGLLLVTQRGQLMVEHCARGKMFSVNRNSQDIEHYINEKKLTNTVSIAAINSPNQTVVSGEYSVIEAMADYLEKSGDTVTMLEVSHAFHSALMAPMLASFRKVIDQVTFHQPKIPIISNITGVEATLEEIVSSDYWVNHISHTVNFEQGIKTLGERCSIMLEVGPKPTLSSLGQQTIDSEKITWLSSLQSKVSNWESIEMTLGKCLIQGVDINWESYYRTTQCKRISLPSYAFEAKRFWIDTYMDTEESPVIKDLADLNIDHSIMLPCLENDFIASYRQTELWVTDAIARICQDLGLFDVLASTKHKRLRFNDLLSRLGIIPKYSRLFSAYLAILEEASWITMEGNNITLVENTGAIISWENLKSTSKNLQKSHPWLADLLSLVSISTIHSADIIQGNTLATDIIFPSQSMALVEDIYKNNPMSDLYNRQLTQVVIQLLANNSPLDADKKTIKIIEIGAGTGGISKTLMTALKSLSINIEYTYSDISMAFIHYGQDNFSQSFDFAKFKILDIENPPVDQGYNIAEYDIVLAANVIHATTDLGNTLNNIKSLLKPGGAFVLNETTRRHNYLTATFGLLDGWWKASDSHRRIEHSPLLTSTKWESLLSYYGFSQSQSIETPEVSGQSQQQHIILGLSDGKVSLNSYRPLINKEIKKPIKEFIKINKKSQKEYKLFDINELSKKPSLDIYKSLSSYLQYKISDIFHFNKKELESKYKNFDSTPLVELGIDSLTGMDIRRSIKQDLTIDLPVTLFVDGTNINNIIEFLHDHILLKNVKSDTEKNSNRDIEVISI